MKVMRNLHVDVITHTINIEVMLTTGRVNQSDLVIISLCSLDILAFIV